MSEAADQLLLGRGWFIAYAGPVVMVHSRRPIDDADFERYLALVGETLDRADPARPLLVLYDVSRGPGSTDAGRRKRLAAVIDKRRDKLKYAIADSAVVTDSALSRGIATALLWLTSPPFEVRMVKSASDGFAWFRDLAGIDSAALNAKYAELLRSCEADPRFA